MIGPPNDLSGGQVIPIIKSGMTKWVRFRAICSYPMGQTIIEAGNEGSIAL